ncbi:hypothetical protein CHUAL_000449 [Chamberlinius hualienensis]
MTSVVNSERSSGDGMESIREEDTAENCNSSAAMAVKTHGLSRRAVLETSAVAVPAVSHHLPSKHREPKFVPYEPYKAAVTPMVVNSKQKNVDSLQQCKSLNLCVKRHTAPIKKTTVIEAAQLKPCKCVVENKMLEEELAKVKAENKALEDQLKIQTEVNKELKNLLVASVGEDMQAKVQFLTEDKTKLAHDIKTYTDKLMEETEAIEKLSIQCDVWRSKYLASSLIVDELAGWKAVLGHHLDEAVDTIKVLLHESEQHRKHQSILNYLKTLDEEKRLNEHNKEGVVTTGVSKEVEALTSKLDKLVSHDEMSDDCSTPKVLPMQSTKGEQMAAKVLAHTTSLARMTEDHLPFQNKWPMSVAGKYGIASRFHPFTRFEGFTYHCYHCKGDIKIL